MKIADKIKSIFPPLGICGYYFLSSLSFCYLYFHDRFSHRTFYEENIGGIYWILSLKARVPNQFRLLVPFIYKSFRTIIPVFSDRAIFLLVIVILMFFIMVVFYNILNEYFREKKTNYWLTFVILYPMFWHYQILNQMFDFTDYANLLFILAGYYLILKKSNKLLLLVFTLGTFNHDSIGFLIVMYLLFNYKNIFKKETLFYAFLMMVVFVAVKILMQEIFKSNPGVSFRFNYEFNYNQFFTVPLHKVLINIILFFGGMHIFVLYFFILGRWKMFRTNYLYINYTIIPYIIIIFLIHTTFEARNYIVSSVFILMMFLLFFSTQKNSFIKPIDYICTPG